MTSTPDGVPHSLLHNLKHNKVLHERVVLLTVHIEDVPYVGDDKRISSEDLGNGFYRVILRYGFMQDPDVPAALTSADICGAKFKMMETSFFQIGRAHVCTPVTNAHLVCRLLLDTQ